jgi:hypothetical protein
MALAEFLKGKSRFHGDVSVHFHDPYGYNLTAQLLSANNLRPLIRPILPT